MSNFSFNPLAWAIKPLYDKAIAEDELFAKEVRQKESRTEKPKSLAECADYILGEAFEWAKEHMLTDNMSFSGLPDDEVVNLIKHYYDEEDIKIKKVTGATASVAKTDAKKDTKKADKKTAPKVVPMTGLFASQSKPVTPPKSKEKAETYDLFAGLWGNDEEEKKVEEKPKVEEKEEEEIDMDEVEEVEVGEMEDDDDLPL